MTLSELRNEVKRNLGRTDTSDTTTDNMVNTAINTVLTEILPEEGLRPYKNYADLTTTANQEYVDLSSLTGFKSIVPDGVGVKDGDDYVKLYPMPQEYYNIESETSQPEYYEIRFINNTPRIYLRPIPDDAYDLRIWYYAEETELSNDTDEAILSQVYGDRVIIAGATMLVAKQLAIEKLAALWEREFYYIEVPKLLNWQSEKLEGEGKFIYNLYL